jgi:choline dehydrogenase-like flavoprotein
MSELRNLDTHGNATEVADVLVIGAGPVGITVARRLAAVGHDVVLVDAGPERSAVRLDEDVCFGREAYRGAREGRAFGLGGTSSLWGGQLLPMRSDELAPATWPMDASEIEDARPELEQWLGVTPADYASPGNTESFQEDTGEWAPRWSKWITFPRRNFAARIDDASGPLRVWLNAPIVEWRATGAPGVRRIIGATARSPSGRALHVHARHFIVSAGALESTRLVLEMQEQTHCLHERAAPLAGRFLHDHLSLPLGRIVIRNRARFERLFAPVFDARTMRSLRLEMTAAALTHHLLPPLYVHFAASVADGSGFAVVRDLLRGVQRRDRRQIVSGVRRMPAALPGLARLAYSRVARSRLAFPPDAPLAVRVDFVQQPRAENRVMLGAQGRTGRRALHIDWSIDADEVAHVVGTLRTALTRLWQEQGFGAAATLDLLADDEVALTNPYDIFHPAGTTRMAVNPADGVVDENLCIHGTANAYVVGSSVFPRLGAANPTLTAMLLASRLAAHLDRSIRADRVAA